MRNIDFKLPYKVTNCISDQKEAVTNEEMPSVDVFASKLEEMKRFSFRVQFCSTVKSEYSKLLAHFGSFFPTSLNFFTGSVIFQFLNFHSRIPWTIYMLLPSTVLFLASYLKTGLNIHLQIVLKSY